MALDERHLHKRKHHICQLLPCVALYVLTILLQTLMLVLVVTFGLLQDCVF